MKIPARRKAVAPVIATLLMIAVAVAMSVIIFMWSQGFLSNTSNSVGGQQGSMNQGAQSAMAVESMTAVNNVAGGAVVIRNVGSVTETIGALTFSPGAANTGMTTALTLTFTAGTSTGCNLAKGAAAVVTLGTATVTGPSSCTIATTTFTPKSGDVINVKATTTVGTFGTTSITVP